MYIMITNAITYFDSDIRTIPGQYWKYSEKIHLCFIRTLIC